MNTHGNYPSEVGVGGEPVSKHLQERQAKQWEEYHQREARYAAALDAAWAAFLATKEES